MIDDDLPTLDFKRFVNDVPLLTLIDFYIEKSPIPFDVSVTFFKKGVSQGLYDGLRGYELSGPQDSVNKLMKKLEDEAKIPENIIAYVPLS